MKKSLLFILLFVLLTCLCSCKEKEIDWDSKIISEVTIVEETFSKNYEYDEFQLSDLLLHVTYTDNMSRDIPMTEDMLSEKDLTKLQKTGSPKVTIEYAGFEISTIIHLIDSATLDKDLNKEGKYKAVIKAIRNKNNSTVSFYLESYDNIASLQFAYTFDVSKMQLSNPILSSSLKGVGKAEVVENTVKFAYAEPGTVLEGEVLLFTVTYAGDFRNSGLKVLDTFNNLVYIADLETYTTTVVEDTYVLYHASVK